MSNNNDKTSYTIRNSIRPNLYGGGQEKDLIVRNSNGETREYTIRNSIRPNLYGSGQEQEIVPKDDYSSYDNIPLDTISAKIIRAIVQIGGAIILLWYVHMYLAEIFGW